MASAAGGGVARTANPPGKGFHWSGDQQAAVAAERILRPVAAWHLVFSSRQSDQQDAPRVQIGSRAIHSAGRPKATALAHSKLFLRVATGTLALNGEQMAGGKGSSAHRTISEPRARQSAVIKMADVLLTQSNHLYSDRKQVKKMQPYPPLKTLLAAAALRERGISGALFAQTFFYATLH